MPTLVSDADGWFKVCVVSDTHLCSKQERLAELKDFYRVLEANGIQTVLHSGNYIDGEAPFNKYELLVRGMDAQLQYLGEGTTRTTRASRRMPCQATITRAGSRSARVSISAATPRTSCGVSAPRRRR